MSLSITEENKIAITITNEEYINDITWEEYDSTWADTGNKTFEKPGNPFSKESKIAITINNESK